MPNAEGLYEKEFKPIVDRYLYNVRRAQLLATSHVRIENFLIHEFDVRAPDQQISVGLVDDRQKKIEMRELLNWGMVDMHARDAVYTSGHQWITVTDARFREASKSRGAQLIQQLEGIHDILFKLRQKMLLKYKELAKKRASNKIPREERAQIHTALDKFWENHSIIEGALSPALTRALIVNLGKNLRNQTGD
ncbi:MAG: hypothetical protein ABIG96_06385 [Candidatus Micrarchaeota archaeon]